MTALKVVQIGNREARSDAPVTKVTQRPKLYVVGSASDPLRAKYAAGIRREDTTEANADREVALAALISLGKKLAVFLAILLAALVLGALLGIWFAPTVSPGGMYQVVSGDTLWAIADKLKGTRSTNDMVALIQELNNFSGGALRVGQQLVIPAS